MNQLGLLMICGIVLISASIFAEAITTPNNDQECGLEFTSIDFSTITVFWKKACFDGDSSYTLEVNGASYCKKSDINSCAADSCEFETKDMSCSGNPIAPCVPVSFIVTGNTYNNETSGDTIAAPFFPDADWNLDVFIIRSNLTAKWGPLTGDYASCATNALLTATCVSPDDGGNKIISRTSSGLIPGSNSTQDLSLDGCGGGAVTLVTATYLSGDAPTETKKTYVDALTYIAAPDAPSVTSVVGNDATPTKLTVTWEKPTTPIGAEVVTGYTITYPGPGGMTVEVDDSEALSYELEGFTACTNYTISVAAKWSGGTGESGSDTGTTGSKAPGKPTNVTSISAAKTEISVSWTPSVISNTCPLTGYTVNWTPKDEGGEHVGDDETTSYTITGLIHSTKYTITVTANTEDKSNVSDIYIHTTAGEKGLSGGAIAGIVCGCLIGVALIVGVIFYCYKKEKLCFEK